MALTVTPVNVTTQPTIAEPSPATATLTDSTSGFQKVADAIMQPSLTPFNQLDLAKWQRVADNDTLMTKAISDFASRYHETRQDIIGNIGLS